MTRSASNGSKVVLPHEEGIGEQKPSELEIFTAMLAQMRQEQNHEGVTQAHSLNKGSRRLLAVIQGTLLAAKEEWYI